MFHNIIPVAASEISHKNVTLIGQMMGTMNALRHLPLEAKLWLAAFAAALAAILGVLCITH